MKEGEDDSAADDANQWTVAQKDCRDDATEEQLFTKRGENAKEQERQGDRADSPSSSDGPCALRAGSLAEEGGVGHRQGYFQQGRSDAAGGPDEYPFPRAPGDAERSHLADSDEERGKKSSPANDSRQCGHEQGDDDWSGLRSQHEPCESKLEREEDCESDPELGPAWPYRCNSWSGLLTGGHLTEAIHGHAFVEDYLDSDSRSRATLTSTSSCASL